MSDDRLLHYGVKGMKWGIRRNRNNKQASREDVKNMSDAELRRAINRLQMEKQYAQLTKKEVSAGQKFVKDVMKEAAKETVKSYVSKYAKKGIDELIDKTISKQETRRYIKRNNTVF